MTLEEFKQDTPEADALARKILETLYECAAAARGAALGSVTITRREPLTRKSGTACPQGGPLTRKSAPTAADRESALPGAPLADGGAGKSGIR